MPTFDYGEVNPATGQIIRKPHKTAIPENGFIEPGDMRVDAGRFFYYVKASAAVLFTPETRKLIEAQFAPTVEETQPVEAPKLVLKEPALEGGEVSEDASTEDSPAADSSARRGSKH